MAVLRGCPARASRLPSRITAPGVASTVPAHSSGPGQPNTTEVDTASPARAAGPALARVCGRVGRRLNGLGPGRIVEDCMRVVVGPAWNRLVLPRLGGGHRKRNRNHPKTDRLFAEHSYSWLPPTCLTRAADSRCGVVTASIQAACQQR